MPIKKSAFLVAFLFVFGCVLSVPRCSLAAVPGGHPASGPGWMPEDKGEAVSADPMWTRLKLKVDVKTISIDSGTSLRASAKWWSR
ncbi:MAG: hypothetical protein C4570_04670 [Ammonifex sp.]|nr:MAG: hypothetical protein C4570_04670 [Ammonifex sp.]